MLSLYGAISKFGGIELNNDDNEYLIHGLCKQLYLRWLKLCDVHMTDVEIQSSEVSNNPTAVTALPTGLAEEFVRENIVWAKTMLQARITVIFNGTKMGEKIDDEYYADAPF
jgi:hypothetical protein